MEWNRAKNDGTTRRFGVSRAKAVATDRAVTLPLARDKRLVVEELGDEVLVYDLDTKNAHCLGPAAAGVWRACDGHSRPDAIARKLGIEGGEVTRALSELRECDLLSSAGDGDLSRRELSVKLVKGAAVVGTLPLILSIAAPAAAQTTSVIAFCKALNPTTNCAKCNEPTGANTNCCCCRFPPSSGAEDGKVCTAGPAQCCLMPGASHCTEGNGQKTDANKC